MELTLRPGVPMGHMMGVPFVCALAAAHKLGVQVAWPYGVVGEKSEPALALSARAGYDDEGMYVALGVEPGPAFAAAANGVGAEDLLAAMSAAVDAWAAHVNAGKAAAGPLAPVLGPYFDAVAGMGGPVRVVRAGRELAAGTLVAVDVWGRATVRLADGQELELTAGQADLALG